MQKHGGRSIESRVQEAEVNFKRVGKTRKGRIRNEIIRKILGMERLKSRIGKM